MKRNVHRRFDASVFNAFTQKVDVPWPFDVPEWAGAVTVENRSNVPLQIWAGNAVGTGEPFEYVEAGASRSVALPSYIKVVTLTVPQSNYGTVTFKGAIRVWLLEDTVFSGLAEVPDGATRILGSAVTLASGATLATASMGAPSAVTVFIATSSAATLAVEGSPDGVNWYAAGSFNPAGAGTTAFSVVPAPYYRLRNAGGAAATGVSFGVYTS